MSQMRVLSLLVPAAFISMLALTPALGSESTSEAGEEGPLEGAGEQTESDDGGPPVEGPAESEASEEAPTDEAEAAGPTLPSITVPTLELPGGAVPGVEGLKGPSTERREAPERRARAPAEFTLHSVEHAHGHRATPRGCIARGRLEGFGVDRFPAKMQPFTTCMRIAADRAVIARLEARILDPRGREVADAKGEIAFEGNDAAIDYIIEWVGFPAAQAGTYELVLDLDRRELARFPLEVAER